MRNKIFNSKKFQNETSLIRENGEPFIGIRHELHSSQFAQ